MSQSEIAKVFKSIWGNPPEVVSSSPARANLIGEHIDYNGGCVLPFAIPFRLTVAASRDGEDWGKNIMDFSSDKFGEWTMGSAIKKKEHTVEWLQIPAGVSLIAKNLGLKVGGKYRIESEIPIGSGLSSSAAFEMALFGAIFALNGKEIDLKKLALLGQRVENEFLGVQSGIMDQMASALGKKNHLLLLDCAIIEHRYVKWPKSDCTLWVVHSGISRTLAKSEYNIRRAECDRALEIINSNSRAQYKYLAQVKMHVIKGLKNKLGLTLYKRAKHVISETKRVYDVVDALQKSDMEAVGEALYESHKSLKNDYEVSCRELNLLVDLAKEAGALGGRLVGAGFGGAAIFLVPNEREHDFLNVSKIYREKTQKNPTVWKVWPDDGLSVKYLR